MNLHIYIYIWYYMFPKTNLSFGENIIEMRHAAGSTLRWLPVLKTGRGILWVTDPNGRFWKSEGPWETIWKHMEKTYGKSMKVHIYSKFYDFSVIYKQFCGKKCTIQSLPWFGFQLDQVSGSDFQWLSCRFSLQNSGMASASAEATGFTWRPPWVTQIVAQIPGLRWKMTDTKPTYKSQSQWMYELLLQFVGPVRLWAYHQLYQLTRTMKIYEFSGVSKQITQNKKQMCNIYIYTYYIILHLMI